MTVKTALMALVAMFATISFSSPTWAYCGTLKYTAKGPTQQEALTKANNKGLVKVRQLDKKYASKVKYETAAFKCSGGNNIVCTITQKYCVKGVKSDKSGGGRGEGCGKGKIFLEGKCIKKSEAASYCGPGYVVSGTKCVHMNDVKKAQPNCPKGQVWNEQEGCHYDD